MNASSVIILNRSFFRSQRYAIMYRYSSSYCLSYIHIYFWFTYKLLATLRIAKLDLGELEYKDNSMDGIQQIICMLLKSFNDTCDTFCIPFMSWNKSIIFRPCLGNHSIMILIIIQTNCSFCQLLIVGFTSAVRYYIKHSSNDVQSNDNKMIGTHIH